MDDWREQAVIFFPAFPNMAETTRMIRIAEAYRDLGGRVVVLSHGGEYEHLAQDAGFEIHQLRPIVTPEMLERIMKVDRMESFGDIFTVEEVREAMEHEPRAYAEWGAKLIVTGFNLMSSLSARIARVPIAWVFPGTSLPPYFKAGFATCPDVLENRLTRLLPDRLKSWVTNRMMLHSNFFLGNFTRSFNRVAREHGVAEFRSPVDLWTGDYTLVSDLREFLNVPSEHDSPEFFYTGPLLAKLEMPLDPEIEAHLERPGRSIYFAMGSSGNKEVYLQALQALAQTGHKVVAAYTTILEEDEVPDLGETVLLRKFVPAEKVNRMVDLAVLHGGQGTIYTAAYAGRPVVGIPMQYEQQYNIDGLVRNGSAIRISKRFFEPRRLSEAVHTMFADYDRYRAAAERLANRLPKVDGALEAARVIREIVAGRVRG